MDIFLVARGYPSSRYPMNGIFEFDQARALSNYGHRVIYLFIDLRSIRRVRKFGIEKFKKDGILHYGINIPLGIFPKNVLSFFAYHGLKIIYKKIKKEFGKPDIMHAHFTLMGYVTSKLKKLNNFPLVITEHSSEIMSKEIDNSTFLMARKAYNYADKLISVSPTLQKEIKNKFDVKSEFIPNIVDNKIFKYNSLGSKKKDFFTFVSVGNLIKHKRMHHTIKAFNKAFKNNIKTRLIIIGNGPEKKNLDLLIKELNLEDRVKLTGHLERKKIADYHRKSDAFVLASKGETFGVAFIEAMTAGLPVISTDCGGPEYFINDKRGLIVERDNIEALANAMKTMYINIDYYNSKKISNEIISQFSPNNIAEKLTKVYSNIN